jgi:hypothetical protein
MMNEGENLQEWGLEDEGLNNLRAALYAASEMEAS